MNLNTDIILDALEKHFDVRRSGYHEKNLVLQRPKFLTADFSYEMNRLYICTSTDLLQPPTVPCLVIFVGRSKPSGWNGEHYGILSIRNADADAVSVMNLLQDVFEYYDTWCNQLARILEKSSDIGEMLSISAVVLGHKLGFCDQNLMNILAAPDCREPQDVHLTEDCLLPAEIAALYAADRDQYISQKECYHCHFPEHSETVCYNIYQQNRFVGVVFMSADDPFRSFDEALFSFFCTYFRKAVRKNNLTSNKLFTLKRIFSDILTGKSVSSSRIQEVLKKITLPVGLGDSWLCMAVRHSGKHRSYPEEYICTLIEEAIPDSIAIAKLPYIVVFINHSEADAKKQTLTSFRSFLEKFHYCCGVSYPFADISAARYYYQQAVCAVETGCDGRMEGSMFFFQDCALAYMLKNSVGDFLPEFILPPELLQLKNWELGSAGGVDYYRTLRVFLDNEMSVTKTAQELYIHRTTLLARLEKIRKQIPLDTSEQRLYIRNCIYMYDLLMDGIF